LGIAGCSVRFPNPRVCADVGWAMMMLVMVVTIVIAEVMVFSNDYIEQYQC